MKAASARLNSDKIMATIRQIKEFANNIRINAIKMVHQANGSHLGGALSMADILAVLYSSVLKVDSKRANWDGRDRFILSKGHACSTLYAALAEKGFFDKKLLSEYCKDGSPFLGHITKSDVPGIEVSTGSLGHGLPIACGMALAAKRDGLRNKIFVLIGDGECDEGTTWEAVLFAQQHRLDNLVLIIDVNGIQSLGSTEEVMSLKPLSGKLASFNWGVREIDGHNVEDIIQAFSDVPYVNGRPPV